jgi:hypothetical protein
VQAAGLGESSLVFPQPFGEPREQARSDPEVARRERSRDCDGLERALAADAAGRRGVEVPFEPRGLERPDLDLDGVRRQICRRRCPERLDPFGNEKPERELLVVPWRPHRHRNRRAVDADLERLLDGDRIALAARLREPHHVDRSRGVRRRLHERSV